MRKPTYVKAFPEFQALGRGDDNQALKEIAADRDWPRQAGGGNSFVATNKRKKPPLVISMT